MVLKLRFSLCMAVIASSLTLLMGVHKGITMTAMIYRTLVSLVLFAVLGYICGQFAERFLIKQMEEIEPKGAAVDIERSDDENGDGLQATEFEPLNPKNLENITLTQK